MANTAKFILTNEDEQNRQRSVGGGSFGNKQSNSGGNAFTRAWDSMKTIRAINRTAQLNGEEPPITLPGYKFTKAMDDALRTILGDSAKPIDRFNEAIQDGIDELVFNSGSITDAVKAGVDSWKSSTTPQTGVSAKPVIYSDWSPVSKLFGMSQDTAFSEHMANTAHQREVADLKAAGLNPVLGISGSGASTVSGSSSTGSSSALKADENNLLDILGATSAVITAVATKNPMYGYMVSNIFKSFD